MSVEAYYETIISFSQRARHRMRRQFVALAPSLLVCSLVLLAMYRAKPTADPVEALGSVVFGVWLYRTVVACRIERAWVPLVIVLADCLVYYICLQLMQLVPAVICSMLAIKVPQLLVQLVSGDVQSVVGTEKTRDQLK